MNQWSYTAIASDGGRAEGQIEARSKGEALHKLNAARLQPLSVVLRSEAPGGPSPVSAPPAGKGAAVSRDVPVGGGLVLSDAQVADFTMEMSTLLDAGLKLERALSSMEGRRELSKLKTVVSRVRVEVREGARFSEALRKASPSFGDLYCRLVEAGELSGVGALPKILRRQAVLLAEMNAMRNRVIQSLLYPATLCVAAIGLIATFMTVLVPELSSLFSANGGQMPVVTGALIAVSGFVGHWSWAILVGAGVGALAFWRVVSQPAGRLWWDRFHLRLPLVGPVVAARYYAQFAQTLSTMVASGIPLIKALQLMHAATANRYLHGVLAGVVESVGDGRMFSLALAESGGFPPAFVDTASVGEETGDMARALENAGSRYDRELDIKIGRVMAVVQPALIAVMSLLVGLFAYSMVTGIFQSMNGIGQ